MCLKYYGYNTYIYIYYVCYGSTVAMCFLLRFHGWWSRLHVNFRVKFFEFTPAAHVYAYYYNMTLSIASAIAHAPRLGISLKTGLADGRAIFKLLTVCVCVTTTILSSG